MGNAYPLLDRTQVESILKALGFTQIRHEGSHAQWEGYTKNKRRLVTVKHFSRIKEKYSHGLLRKMIQQSGLSKKEFYRYL